MKKRSWVILIGLSLLCGIAVWRIVEYEPVYDGWCKLKARPSDSPAQSALVTLASQALLPMEQAPNDIGDLPQTFTDPHFYQMRVGDGYRNLIIDLSGKPRLCLDTNGDGRLCDEQPFTVKSVKDDRQRGDRFGPIHLTSEQADGQGGVFYLTIYNRQKAGLAWLHPTHLRQGRLRVGKRIYKVAVVDGDFDGRFNSVVSLPVHSLVPVDLAHSDVLAIDYDRDGQFERNDYGRSEVVPLGRMIYAWHKYYAVNIAPDGSKLELKPIEPEMGKLALDVPNARSELALWSDAASQQISFTSDKRDLPAGKYQTLHAMLMLGDGQGNTWTFTSNDKVGDLDVFNIRANETTHFKLGPPFVVTANVEQRNDIVYISPAIRGRAGEEYRLDFRRNNRQGQKPTFKIVAEDGVVLVSDTFEYG